MSLSGQELNEHNQRIVKCIVELKSQRQELNYLIEKQQEEKIRLQTEVERISYKLTLVNKSLGQRLTTRQQYDKTIKDAEERYNRLVESSGSLLEAVETEAKALEQSTDKKVGTEPGVVMSTTSQPGTRDLSERSSLYYGLVTK